MKALQLPAIETERLTLRKLEASDWEVVSYLRTDEEVNKYVDRPSAPTREKALAFIAKITADYDKGEAYYWAIAKKGAPEMIGSICLWNISDDYSYAEVGYDLHPAHQGKGIMSEALQAVIDYGFNHLKITTIEAYTHRHNRSSTGMLTKNGFRLVPGKVDEDNANNAIYKLINPAAADM
ncbi:MAG: GNAT family N-acetyltransferase [Cyclobacteriaceae bacterium]